MAAASPAYLEIITSLAAGTTPAALISFRPSPEAQRRVSELIARRHEGAISAEGSRAGRLSRAGTCADNGQGSRPPAYRSCLVTSVSDAWWQGAPSAISIANILGGACPAVHGAGRAAGRSRGRSRRLERKGEEGGQAKKGERH